MRGSRKGLSEPRLDCFSSDRRLGENPQEATRDSAWRTSAALRFDEPQDRVDHAVVVMDLGTGVIDQKVEDGGSSQHAGIRSIRRAAA